jgi:glycosyltransferase involved in cell wall biosynthesis
LRTLIESGELASGPARAKDQGAGEPVRILVHDYAGHPFQFDLSRALARRGHIVLHAYFAGDQGPKGQIDRLPDDPATLTIKGLSLDQPYDKGDLFGRHRNDIRYGAIAGQTITDFSPDVVISGNTPLDAQSQIQAASTRSGAAFVNWIQDFYSAAISELLSSRWFGLGRMVAARYGRLERQQLQASDHIVVISDDFRPMIQRMGVDVAKVTTIPNWGPLDNIPQRPKSNPWSRSHGLADSFVFAYSGTLGLKHNPALLTALADHFADRPEVAVVVAASGLGLDELKNMVAKHPRPNLKLLPLIDFAEYPDYLGAADVLIGVLEKDAGRFSVPSKVLAYLCAGRSILLSAPLQNQAAQLVKSIDAGPVTAPDDEAAFLAAATELYANAAHRQSCGQNGRAYAETHFGVERVADRFEAIFLSLAAPSHASRLRFRSS